MIIFWFVLLIVIERKSSIKILARLLITILTVYLGYVKAIVNNQNIVVFTIIVTFLLITLNILIKEGIHRKAFLEIISVLIISIICGVAVLIISLSTGITVVDNNKYIELEDKSIDKNIIFGIVILALLGIFMDIVSRITSCLDKE
jgi:uncharacterized membrane protein